MLLNGWLYNVSGLKAIELRFKHKPSVVRIGTDNPHEISQLIQSLIGSENIIQSSGKPVRKWIKPLFYLVVLLILALSMIPKYQEPKVQFDNDAFKIKGFYGVTIPFKDIEQIDTVSAIPNISLRTNGYASGNTLIGNFRFTDDKDVKLFVKIGFAPYVLIKSKESVPVYINFEKKQATVDLYNRLKIKK